jgi:hypothetical protein
MEQPVHGFYYPNFKLLLRLRVDANGPLSSRRKLQFAFGPQVPPTIDLCLADYRIRRVELKRCSRDFTITIWILISESSSKPSYKEKLDFDALDPIDFSMVDRL